MDEFGQGDDVLDLDDESLDALGFHEVEEDTEDDLGLGAIDDLEEPEDLDFLKDEEI